MSRIGNPVKSALRKKMKNIILKMPADAKKRQSDAITERVISSRPFENAKRISIFLSKVTEVDTIGILTEMFKQEKQVFVPVYDKHIAEMVKLYDMRDYESLPCTKQGIKQPMICDHRENALDTGGIDLFIVPGAFFTANCGRLGYGLGFYDRYFKRHYEMYPERKTVLMAVAFKEQIVPEDQLPLEEHDVKLDFVVTEDYLYSSK